jgi:hypothetical protein
MATTRVQITSVSITLWESSWPPLKPMENKRYRVINLEELAGISRSLFNWTAKRPRQKNNKEGLVRLSANSFHSKI